jgi:mono/diheme cytochrome c family protein
MLGRKAARAQTTDQDQIDLGARLYAENCAVCHGPNGEGRVGATLAKNWPSIRPDLTVRTTIENGVPGAVMPAWSQKNGGPLSDEEIDALVAYILSWQTGSASNIPTIPTNTPRPPITPVADVVGDPNQGAVLFDQNCVVCHGPNGEGRIGATLAKPWASVRPSLTIKSTIAEGVSGSLMPAWAQVNGGPLTDQQIDHLVAFILSRPNSTVEEITVTAEPVPSTGLSWLSGWAGVLLFLFLFIAIIASAIILQRQT